MAKKETKETRREALVVKDLRKTYKKGKEAVHALNGVTFTVYEGEIFGLLGPNGAGKTTTINSLTGLLDADSGEVSYFGKPWSQSVREFINVTNGYSKLNGGLTVEQNLRVYAMLYDVKNREERITELLRKFAIEDLRKRRIHDLSSGQRARVNICKALINSPRLLFLDEATAGLDPDVAQIVRKEIKALDTTIIFTSHIMREVEELCDRVAFIKDGKVVVIDTPVNIQKQHKVKNLDEAFVKMSRAK